MSKSSASSARAACSTSHRQQIDAEAHIAGFDDRRMARRRFDPGVVFRRTAGGADDMGNACLRGIAGEFDGRPPAW